MFLHLVELQKLLLPYCSWQSLSQQYHKYLISSGFTSSVIAMSYHSFRRQGTVIFDDKMTEIQKSSSCHLITIWELGLLLLEHLSHLLFPADNIEFSTFSFLFSFLNLSLIQPLLFVPLLCFGSCSIPANMIKK